MDRLLVRSVLQGLVCGLHMNQQWGFCCDSNGTVDCTQLLVQEAIITSQKMTSIWCQGRARSLDNSVLVQASQHTSVWLQQDITFEDTPSSITQKLRNSHITFMFLVCLLPSFNYPEKCQTYRERSILFLHKHFIQNVLAVINIGTFNTNTHTGLQVKGLFFSPILTRIWICQQNEIKFST
jgi:hypothetical protein